MKVTLVSVIFVLSVAGVTAFYGQEETSVPQHQAPAETRSRFAALDDVRLLANGLLQLGHSLREFVQRTKGQINDIFQKLNIFDRSFYQLSVLTSEIKEEGEELKKTTVVLKANSEEIKGMSAQINSKVENILQERSQLESKVDVLEMRLSSLSQGLVTSEQVAEINDLKAVIHSQERSITELLKAVRDQSDQINFQKTKIKNLEEKLSVNTLAQETIEGMSEPFNNEPPTLTPFSSVSHLFRDAETASDLCSLVFVFLFFFFFFFFFLPDYGATVIQRRINGSVNFDQTWEKYEHGFGDLQGEFWLGLGKIHTLAAQGNTVLDIQLEDWKHSRHFVKYRFYLEGPESNYTIHLKYLSGDLPDLMGNHAGVTFSTRDRDKDGHRDSNCAHQQTGGWWFNVCGDTNPNGRYFHVRPKGRSERRRGVQWKSPQKVSYSFRLTQISVHPGPPFFPTPASPSSFAFF
ncbi:angiopoietin-related protein 3-like [Cynoglossus semilaevis]|uniref:angiopoietin-related protein 3-like n=1 Tax=Cynoglossus semilaevis TaxID=244447 RepID=UPI000D630EEE|nr:angiopoietin-related protein 3-like [Cynoglossus semilaevis]